VHITGISYICCIQWKRGSSGFCGGAAVVLGNTHLVRGVAAAAAPLPLCADKSPLKGVTYLLISRCTPMTQMVLCEPGALGAQPSSHFVGVHSMRKGAASFLGSLQVLMPHALSWNMRIVVARYAILTAPSPASIE
jgi:hypothetical protein